LNKGLTVLALAGLLGAPVLADFSYEQTARMSGGTLLRMMRLIPGGGKAAEPQTSRISIKGNRMSTVSAKQISIIDLDAETMTDVDLDKKTYAVITFAEFKEIMLAMQQKMSQQKTEGMAMDFRVDVKETGEKRTIDGHPTRQFIMNLATDMKDQKSGQTVTTEMVMDMWLAPRVAGYEEVQRFYARMAEKLNWTPSGMSNNPMMMGQAGFGEGTARIAKEMSKLDGIPVLGVMTMKGGGPGAGGEMPEMPNVNEAVSDAARQETQSTASSQARRAGGGRFGGLAGAAAGGIFGGLGKKKKQEEPPAEAAQEAKPKEVKAASLMEITTEMRGFSTAAVDAAQLAVPAGFKQVEHQMKKMAR
jgi:hypothetical protein